LKQPTTSWRKVRDQGALSEGAAGYARKTVLKRALGCARLLSGLLPRRVLTAGRPSHDGRANAASHLPALITRQGSRPVKSLAHPNVRLATGFHSSHGGSFRNLSLIAHFPPGGGWLLQRRSKLVDFRKGPRESAASSCRALGTSRCALRHSFPGPEGSDQSPCNQEYPGLSR